MPAQVENLHDQVLAALGAGALKAKEIAALVARKGVVVTTTEVNALLYGALADRVTRSEDYRWTL